MNSFVSKLQLTTKTRKLFFLALFVLILLGTASTANAATPGFVKKGKSTYYRQQDGTYYKGGFIKINGKYYYFNKSTGKMFTGWQVVKGQKKRYFSKKGVMATGYVKDSKGRTRYFKSNGVLYRGYGVTKSGKVQYFESKEGIMATGWLITGSQYRYFDSNGYMVTGTHKMNNEVRYFCKTKPANVKKNIEKYGAMYVGLHKIGKYYYYFSPAKIANSTNVGGVMTTSKAVTVKNKTYYFKANGKAVSGWLTLKGKKYYFDSSCVLLKNTTLTIDGVRYKINSKGVATALLTTTTPISIAPTPDGNLTATDITGRQYPIYAAYNTIPGIANGAIDDATLLAAVADREMGASSFEGMLGVCMCIMNRSLPENTAFPSDFRMCIFQMPWQFSESSDGSFTVLEKRLRGIGWANKSVALKAAQTALQMRQDYLTKGTPRKIAGYKTNDFDYIGFMTPDFFRASVGKGGFDPGKSETFAGICTYFDCWNKAYGNK